MTIGDEFADFAGRMKSLYLNTAGKFDGRAELEAAVEWAKGFGRKWDRAEMDRAQKKETLPPEQ